MNGHTPLKLVEPLTASKALECPADLLLHLAKGPAAYWFGTNTSGVLRSLGRSG